MSDDLNDYLQPWAGDTESGFGNTATLDLPRDDAIDLARKILKFFDSESRSEDCGT